MGVAIHLGEDVAKQISDGKKQHASAKHHGAQPGQLDLSGLARSNQVGAQQHADKSHHDEVVILVSAGRVGVGHGVDRSKNTAGIMGQFMQTHGIHGSLFLHQKRAFVPVQWQPIHNIDRL